MFGCRRTACLLILPLLLASAGCWMDDPFWDDEGYGPGAPPYVGGQMMMQNGAPAYSGEGGGRVVPLSMQTAEPPR